MVPQEVENTSDPVVPVALFKGWRGSLFDSTAPDARIDLDGRDDFVEVVILDVQLPDVLLDELRRRAALGGADGGP